MARYLSDEWFTAVADALTGATTVPGRLTIQQTVTGGPDGDVEWMVTVGQGAVRVSRGQAAEPDATFTQSYSVAAAVAQGHRSAQAAFMAGEITLGGASGALIAAAPALAQLGDALAAVRATTTY